MEDVAQYPPWLHTCLSQKPRGSALVVNTQVHRVRIELALH